MAKTSRSKSPRKEPQKRHRSPRRDSSTRGLKRRHTAPSMRESSTKSEAGTEPCPVAGCRDVVSRAHAATHLPGIFEDTQELTEELLRRQISALRIIESLVLGSVSNMEGLVTFVNQLRQIRTGQYTVPKRQQRAMTDLCRLQGFPVPEEFCISPANSPGVLLHWRVLLVLFACLSAKDQQEVTEQYPVSTSWRDVEGLPDGFDSHFHLDRSRNVLHRPDASVEEICSAIRPDAEFKYKLIGGVVIFCDPPSYPTREDVRQLQDDGFLVGIGLHPKQSEQYSEADFASFQRCLEYPEVKVLGEIGLDYSVNRSSWAAQHLVLDRVLKHLQPTQVLVHARGDRETLGLGYYQLLFQLKGVVSSNQRIHVHCFEGDHALVETWLGEFPNTLFGFTGLVQHFNRASKEALRRLPEDKLLLETDSPYFRIGGRHNSSPALLGMVANMVADIRGQEWKEILGVALRNASLLYQ